MLRIKQTLGQVKACARTYEKSYEEVSIQDCQYHSVNDLLVIDQTGQGEKTRNWIVFVMPISFDTVTMSGFNDRDLYHYDVTLLNTVRTRRIY